MSNGSGTSSRMRIFKNHIPVESQSIASSQVALRAHLDPEKMQKTELA